MTNKAEIKPIFIFSLPRSGSTLLQRMLATHTSISSASEPWVLLPLMGMLDNNKVKVFSNFSTRISQVAIRDFYKKSPKGVGLYFASVRAFLQVGYKEYCQSDEIYFLDKTPRYYLIVDEIYKLFPDAKCIFLFRNPLEVMASSIRTWGDGEFKLHGQYVDFQHGLKCLHDGYKKHEKKSIKILYNDLVESPELTMKAVCSFLDLEYDHEMVDAFSETNFMGEMGDPIGVKKYSKVMSCTNNSWSNTLNSPLRRWYCKRYIKYVGDDILKSCGLTEQELLNQLQKAPLQYKKLWSDFFWIVASFANRYVVSKLLNNKNEQGVLRYDYFN